MVCLFWHVWPRHTILVCLRAKQQTMRQYMSRMKNKMNVYNATLIYSAETYFGCSCFLCLIKSNFKSKTISHAVHLNSLIMWLDESCLYQQSEVLNSQQPLIKYWFNTIYIPEFPFWNILVQPKMQIIGCEWLMRYVI